MLPVSDPTVLRQIRNDLDEFLRGHAPGSIPELKWLVRRLRGRQCHAAVEAAIQRLAAAGSKAIALVTRYL